MLILIVLEIKNIKTIVYLDMVYIILYPFNIFFLFPFVWTLVCHNSDFENKPLNSKNYN